MESGGNATLVRQPVQCWRGAKALCNAGLVTGLTQQLLAEQNDRNDDHGRSGETTDTPGRGGACLQYGL